MRLIIKIALLLLVILVALFVLLGKVNRIELVPEKSFKNSIGMEMVCLSKEYWVSKYEVTQGQYEEVMGNNPTFHRYVGSKNPVSSVKGFEAEDFCNRLTESEKLNNSLSDGYVYALPSFKEWLEYVADAPLEGSVTSGNYNYPHNSAFLQPVGSGEKNRLGVYDLRGNVCEYSRDKYEKSNYIFGASWGEKRKGRLRIRNKGSYGRNDASCDVGFRCVLVRAKKLSLEN